MYKRNVLVIFKINANLQRKVQTKVRIYRNLTLYVYNLLIFNKFKLNILC